MFGSLIVKFQHRTPCRAFVARFVTSCGGRRDSCTTQALKTILRANKARLKRKDDRMTENYDNNIYNEPYCVREGCLYETIERKGKVTTVRLCDYVPVLKSEITFDDGTEQRKAFEIGAVHSNGTTMPTVTFNADEMSSMKWLIEKWGSLGSYSPANNTLGKIRHAIMSTKSDVEFKTVYSQTGWRKIGEQYEFLMPSAESELTVDLQGKLNAYHWSAPASTDKLFYLTALLENGLLPQRVKIRQRHWNKRSIF